MLWVKYNVNRVSEIAELILHLNDQVLARNALLRTAVRQRVLWFLIRTLSFESKGVYQEKTA